MEQNQYKENPDVLLVVAHPDDETIFCGGTILIKKHWQWSIVLCAYQVGESRYEEFEKAISYYERNGVSIKSYRTLGLKDSNMNPFTPNDWEHWREAFKTIKESPDIVITHNVIGEYDHPDHKAANIMSRELFNRVHQFICPGSKNYIDFNGFIQYPNPEDYKIDITQVLTEKRKIFNECHVSQTQNWSSIPDIMQYEFTKGPEIFRLYK